MKHILFIILISFSVLSLYAQDEDASVTVGINAGTDHNINAFQTTPNTKYNYQYYGINNQYSFGADFGVFVTNKLRPRIEIRYVNTSYGVKWNNPDYDFIRSTWNINNLDINLRLDYRLLFTKKFEILASPGLKFEFYTADYLKTTLKNGSTSSEHWNILDYGNPTSIAGGAFSMIFKYNFTRRIGFTVTPDYTIFFRDYVSSNDKAYQRLSLNGGFEFKFM